MNYPTCKARMEARNVATGEIAFATCSHPLSTKFRHQVLEFHCEACPVRAAFEFNRRDYELPKDLPEQPQFKTPVVREDGTLVYERQGWEPPPEHIGYRRKSRDFKTDEAWQFVPDWPECDYKQMKSRVKPSCGCLAFTVICRHPDSPQYLGVIQDKAICEGCPLRCYGTSGSGGGSSSSSSSSGGQH